MQAGSPEFFVQCYKNHTSELYFFSETGSTFAFRHVVLGPLPHSWWAVLNVLGKFAGKVMQSKITTVATMEGFLVLFPAPLRFISLMQFEREADISPIYG